VYAKADSNRREPLPAQASEAVVAGTARWPPSLRVCAWPAARREDPQHRHHAQGSMSKWYATLEKLAARGNPGLMLSKNFLAVPQLDVDFCTALLCVPCCGNDLSLCVSI
jgi:hypothetical protein